MADLFSILSQGAASMDAQQTVSATTSNNIANANNPGYSKQTAVLEALLPTELIGGAFVGRGVGVQTVTQTRDLFLERQLPAAFSSAASSSAQASTLTSLSALDPQAQGGLSAALGNFYSALQAMSQNPGNAGLRQAAVAAAQGLAVAFNNTASGLTQARGGVDAQLDGLVPQINGLSQQIAKLNDQISSARSSGAEPNDLLDARQAAQDQLSQLTGASALTDAHGNVSMVLANGQALVSGDQASTLSTFVDASNGGHLGLQLAPPGGAAALVPGASVGGTVGGLMSARDGALLAAQNQVDQLAFDLGTAVNSVQQGGFTAAGAPGGALFNLTATAAGAASQIQVSAAVVASPSLLAAAGTPTGGSGDASNLLAMIATASQTLSSGNTAAGTLSSLTAAYGAAAQQAQNQSTADGSALQQLQQLRASASGVSINDEMINLTKTQQVYQALGRVISATDAMLTSLLQIS